MSARNRTTGCHDCLTGATAKLIANRSTGEGADSSRRDTFILTLLLRRGCTGLHKASHCKDCYDTRLFHDDFLLSPAGLPSVLLPYLYRRTWIASFKS